MTDAEYQKLMELYGLGEQGRNQTKQKLDKAAISSSSVGDVFESAVKTILDSDASKYIQRTGSDALQSANEMLGEYGFARGGMFDVSKYLPTKQVGEAVIPVAVAGVKGLGSGVAGLASLPREIPRLAETGYEYATGEDVDFDVLKSTGLPTYQEAAEFLGATLPEDASTAEKAVFYGIESLPMFGGGGLRNLAMRTAQGAGAGFASEVNPLLGVAAGAASVPGASRKGVKETRLEALDADSQRLAEQSLSEFGIQETRGQALYRRAMQETNPRLRTTKLAEAERVLALEEAGRRVDPRNLKEGVRSNVELWKENDVKQANQVEAAMRKIAGVPEGRKKPAEVSRTLAEMYNGWSKKRMKSLREANRRDFEQLDPSIKFDLEFILDDIDELIERFNLAPGARVTDAPSNAIMKIRKKILTEKGQLKELNANQIQTIMSDLGRIAFSGRIAGVADIDPGDARNVAQALQKIFGNALVKISEDSTLGIRGATQLSGEQAKLLTDIRTKVAGRFKALEDETSGPLMEFFKYDAYNNTPTQIIEKLEESFDDPDKVRIFSSLIRQEHPTLWPEVKQALFNREMRRLADENGNLSIFKLKQAKERLLENEILFGDSSASAGLNQLESLFNTMEGMFQRIDPADLSDRDVYKAMKLGSEIGGSLGGPKARYVSEAVTKFVMLAKGNRLPAEAAAELAINPNARNVMVKVLKGQAATLTPAEMTHLRKLITLGKIQTSVGLPAIYFGRDEDQKASLERAEKAVTSLFSEAVGQ